MEKTSSDSMNSNADLIEFARQYGPADVDYEGAVLQPLSGDAGFRRYYRLSSQPSLMLVDSPPEKERNLEYVRVNDFLRDNGVFVPRIHAVSFERGIFIIEDLGDQVLQDTLSINTAQALYDQAMAMLINIQSIDQRPDWVEDYSAEKLDSEMQLFPDWFVKELLGVDINPETEVLLQKVFSQLVESAQDQPQCFVHRDFHCRNLMLKAFAQGADKQLFAIDFQDAVWGPICYDLVSISRDCYLRWDEKRVTETIQGYADKLQINGLISEQQQTLLPRWVDWMGLQRHIKVLGIFARLCIRDGKPSYLDDLSLVLRYILEVLDRYPENEQLSSLKEWILDDLIPVAEKQSWYRDWRTAGKFLDF